MCILYHRNFDRALHDFFSDIKRNVSKLKVEAFLPPHVNLVKGRSAKLGRLQVTLCRKKNMYQSVSMSYLCVVTLCIILDVLLTRLAYIIQNTSQEKQQERKVRIFLSAIADFYHVLVNHSKHYDACLHKQIKLQRTLRRTYINTVDSHFTR